MPKTITIKDVPQDTIDLMKARAKKAGVSFSRYMTDWVTSLAEAPDPDDKVLQKGQTE